MRRSIFASTINCKRHLFQIQINVKLKKTSGNSITLVKLIMMISNVHVLQYHQVNQEITMDFILLWKIILNHILQRILIQLFNMEDGALLLPVCLILTWESKVMVCLAKQVQRQLIQTQLQVLLLTLDQWPTIMNNV